jgi:hypothetical protein
MKMGLQMGWSHAMDVLGRASDAEARPAAMCSMHSPGGDGGIQLLEEHCGGSVVCRRGNERGGCDQLLISSGRGGVLRV